MPVQHSTARKVSKCFVSWISERGQGGPLLPKETQPLLWWPGSSACLVQSPVTSGTCSKAAELQFSLVWVVKEGQKCTHFLLGSY